MVILIIGLQIQGLFLGSIWDFYKEKFYLLGLSDLVLHSGCVVNGRNAMAVHS